MSNLHVRSYAAIVLAVREGPSTSFPFACGSWILDFFEPI